jgi:hypothetical protein
VRVIAGILPAADDSRAFGSLGPRAGAKVVLAAGRRFSFTAELSFAALFRNETDYSAMGTSFHPVIFGLIGTSYSP